MEPTLVILGIGFVVWLVSTLYKNAEDAKRRVEPERAQRVRAGTTEIDRFLEEIQRRRMQQQAQQQGQRPLQVEPLRARPVPPSAERPPIAIPARPLPARPLPARPVPARPLPARPVEMGRPLRAVPVAQPAPALVLSAADESTLVFTPQSASPPIRLEESKTESADLKGLIALLHSKKGVRQAMLLGMILGPPKCRQPLGQSRIL